VPELVLARQLHHLMGHDQRERVDWSVVSLSKAIDPERPRWITFGDYIRQILVVRSIIRNDSVSPMEKSVNDKDLNAFKDVKKHLERAVDCLAIFVAKVDDILGDGLRKKKSPFYLMGQVAAAKTLPATDRQTVEGHIAILDSVRPDMKAAYKDLGPLAKGHVDVGTTFSDLEQLRRTYAKAFVSGDRVFDLKGKFFPSLKEHVKSLYDSQKLLYNGSMIAIYEKLPEYFKEYPTAGMVLWPTGKKK
jgi:hypothetical protein